jgi:hypothetical protein
MDSDLEIQRFEQAESSHTITLWFGGGRAVHIVSMVPRKWSQTKCAVYSAFVFVTLLVVSIYKIHGVKEVFVAFSKYHYTL